MIIWKLWTQVSSSSES